jgi:hypothetical protein
MKITRKQLRQLIKEELTVSESYNSNNEDSQCCSGCSNGEQCCNDKQKHDSEGKMSKSQLYRMMKYVTELYDMIDDNEDLPEWVQNKITKSVDQMNSVYNYMDSHENRPESLGHM